MVSGCIRGVRGGGNGMMWRRRFFSCILKIWMKGIVSDSHGRNDANGEKM